jgi:hypothetical protein
VSRGAFPLDVIDDRKAPDGILNGDDVGGVVVVEHRAPDETSNDDDDDDRVRGGEGDISPAQNDQQILDTTSGFAQSVPERLVSSIYEIC